MCVRCRAFSCAARSIEVTMLHFLGFLLLSFVHSVTTVVDVDLSLIAIRVIRVFPVGRRLEVDVNAADVTGSAGSLA